MISIDEYNKDYFDGPHLGGYSCYERNLNRDSDDPSGLPITKSYHKRLYDLIHEDQANPKIIELGSAKGFLIEDFVSFGADIQGVECSSYARSCAHPDIQAKIHLSEALSYLSNLEDGSFDVVIALRFLPCFNDEQLSSLLSEINRISGSQYYLIDSSESYPDQDAVDRASQFYNIKSSDGWSSILPDTAYFESFSSEEEAWQSK